MRGGGEKPKEQGRGKSRRCVYEKALKAIIRAPWRRAIQSRERTDKPEKNNREQSEGKKRLKSPPTCALTWQGDARKRRKMIVSSAGTQTERKKGGGLNGKIEKTQKRTILRNHHK